MSPLLFVLWSAVCVLGTGGLVYFVMHSRMEVRLARQREELAVERAVMESRRQTMEESIRGAEQVARSKAVDEVLADLRIEERHYVREHRALFMTRKSVEEGADIEKLAQTMAIFNSALMPVESGEPRKLLR